MAAFSGRWAGREGWSSRALVACALLASADLSHAKPAPSDKPVFLLAQTAPEKPGATAPPDRGAAVAPAPTAAAGPTTGRLVPPVGVPANGAAAGAAGTPVPAGAGATTAGPATASGAAVPTEIDKPGPTVAVPPMSPPPSDPGQRARWLSDRIEQLIQTVAPPRVRVGVAVLDIDSGKLLYGKNDGAQFNIASNVKLVTTASALAILGPEYRFKTALYADRDRDCKPGEYKNVYLRGYGDPTVSTEDLWRLASELSSRNIKRIKGDLVIDDTFFDEQRLAPAYEQKNQDSAYRAAAGAISLNYNAVSIRVQPGAAEGQPARISLDPPSAYFLVVSEARTISSGRGSLFVEASEEKDAAPGREHTVIRVRGTIRLGDAGQDFTKRVSHPDLYAGYTLSELIGKRGIQIGGRVTRGTAPTTATLIESHYSQPLGILVREINKRSNNFMAEQVLKSLGADSSGRPGSWQKGLQAVSRYLESLGILPGKYQMVNGSGLFDSNRFTPAQVVTLLRSAYRDFRFAADFIASLAVSGTEGTIHHRMSGGIAERYVRAKTGTLNGISCLSGYAGAPLPSGLPMRAPLAFSVLVNDIEEGGGAPSKRLQDSIVETLVAYQSGLIVTPGAPPPVGTAPAPPPSK